jgi:hypothetical protein
VGTVRVLRYRQHKPDGDVVEANWLTKLSSRRISRRCLYAMAKRGLSRPVNAALKDGKPGRMIALPSSNPPSDVSHPTPRIKHLWEVHSYAYG